MTPAAERQVGIVVAARPAAGIAVALGHSSTALLVATGAATQQ